ncbi:MAG: molybdopterin-dependent oxidoreductase [Pseudomonadota bacterium]
MLDFRTYPVCAFTRFLSLVTLAVLLFSHNAFANLQAPSGRVLLSVSGNIQTSNSADGAHFDRELFSSIGTSKIKTKTPWTESSDTFEGVLVRDLLERVGAKSSRFRAIAHNDYEVTVEGIDFDQYPVILATRMNGKKMTLREKGPVWIIFPWDDHPELATKSVKRFSIWQLKSIIVQ